MGIFGIILMVAAFVLFIISGWSPKGLNYDWFWMMGVGVAFVGLKFWSISTEQHPTSSMTFDQRKR